MYKGTSPLVVYEPDLPHRARAAFRAASDRCSGVIFAARASPPLSPPRLPRATASGSLPALVASSTMLAARTFTSWGAFLLERFGTVLVYHAHKIRTGARRPLFTRRGLRDDGGALALSDKTRFLSSAYSINWPGSVNGLYRWGP